MTENYENTYIKLAKYRKLFISEDITNTLAAELSAMLLYFDNINNELPIEIYLHTDGGSAEGLMNIYDIMQIINAPIKTICTGKCYSAGAILLSAGAKGERYAFKNSSIMIHGIQFTFPYGDMIESQNYYNFINDNNHNVMKILAKHTNKSLKEIKNDCKEDIYLTARRALSYGIIDHII